MKAYCIKSKADLINMQKNMTSSAIWPSDNANYAFYLTKNIDLGTQSSWTPIRTTIGGTSFEKKFKFYGNGFKISGDLTCTGTCALFSTISQGYVDNLKINLKVNGTGACGSFTTKFNNGTFESIVIESEITSSSGVAGGLFADGGSVTLKHIYVSGSVKGSAVGGIAGSINSSSNVHDFRYNGSIYGNSSAGGVFGSCGATVEIYDAEINATINGNDNVGGIIGYSHYDATIERSYFNGSLTGASNVGGILGSHPSSNGLVTIKDSAVFGTVKGTSTSSSNVGGLFGSGYVDVKESFTVADISNAMNAAQIGTFTGETFTATTAYSAGLFTNVTQKSDDIQFLGTTANEELVLSYSNTGNGKFKHYYTFNSSNAPYYNSKTLFIALNEAAGSTVWEQRTCTITTGPAKGTTKQVSLAIPKALGEISICSW
jgi:hypothetical protein